ncbi:caspase-1-like [Cimex lectularius]|uniref:Caspase n=1 Tax=Cimex lectularius TaxID=79782 RepID=A0A8I6RLA0_CIMLE|nr:caspase-1-like [Cimex lectularius]
MDGDSIDAKIANGSKVDEPDILGFRPKSRDVPKMARMSVEKDAYFYKMTHKKRGIAVIFNHEKFLVGNLTDRTGTNADSEALEKCFTKLGFDVMVFKDLSCSELISQVEKVAEMDHSDNDCLVMCILSHGEENFIFACDTLYKHEEIWGPFTADKCPTLAGKPKMFFIQACQGKKLDPGIRVTQVDSSPYSYKIPIHADFLIAYSTIPGFFSWRNTGKGSWFIQALTAELEESAFLYDMLTILTFVNRRVAVDFESNVPGNTMMDAQKQMPCITSMLTRLVKFPEIKNK